MNIRQLRSFIATVDMGSFTAAGDHIGLSTAAVSLQIKSLEEELGAKLFEREQRPLQLNRHGYALVNHARSLLEEFDRTRLVVHLETPPEVLRLGTVNTVMVSILPPSLKTLKAEYPDFKISVCGEVSATLTNLLIQDKLDAAILNKPSKIHPGFVWYELLREPLIVIAPESYRGESYQELISGNPFIWFDRSTWEGQIIEAHIQAYELDIDSSIEMDSLDAIALMVANGMGVSVVPKSTGVAALHKKVKVREFGDPPVSRVLGVLSKACAGKARSVDALVAAIRRQIKTVGDISSAVKLPGEASSLS